jgi:hypothetical protein
VTVRYREDTRELRFTYANDLALQELKKLKPHYPDGAKFAKVSFIGEGDPAFPSSLAPSGARRYQFMVKDHKKYKGEASGWGYALFDASGKIYNENVKEKTEACIACHQLVPERNYVFSRRLLREGDEAPIPGQASGIKFNSKKRAHFVGTDIVKQASSELESLEGALQKHAFSGTLDEVIPLLLERSRLLSRDATLFLDDKNFSWVQFLGQSKTCLGDRNKEARIRVRFNGAYVRDSKVCL